MADSERNNAASQSSGTPQAQLETASTKVQEAVVFGMSDAVSADSPPSASDLSNHLDETVPVQVILPESGSTHQPCETEHRLAEDRGDDTMQKPSFQSPGKAEGVRRPGTSQSTEPLPVDEHVDEYIRSPEVQNAIVERSPGGRYVRFMEKLGSGASKDVYRAYDTEEGIEVAWNVVSLSGVPKSERNRIINEVKLLARLHHRNIISFHGSWVNRERQEVNFVTEILSSGTLKSFINKVQVIRWKIAKRWAVQILHGLEYLHAQEPPVIHRDLKCENIFINGTSGDLRIGDLGLSTVHRNGKLLSVLGTPEFMAPDMYEDKPYDEKVDIYAFGLCVLEIFTKEIPYSECSNPAQIYKKVSNGETPDVLSRLESKHAREFVELCLGYKDEEGRYVRPSAAELLQHPFLVKRANDDDEVMVDPPMRESVILENGETTATVVSLKPASASQDSTTAEAVTSASKPRQSKQSRVPDEDPDQFEKMPEMETNMRKVTVLMGRDTELNEDEYHRKGEYITVSENEDKDPKLTSTAAEPIAQSQSPTYLVAAAVIGNENLSVRPYADDILKLVVTLPVEGQTQNVHFDFHLVEDDPVQVAKEMVRELHIPQEAMLEISETISGLACAARMKQDKYAVRMQAQIAGRQMTQQQENNTSAQSKTDANHTNALPIDTGNESGHFSSPDQDTAVERTAPSAPAEIDMQPAQEDEQLAKADEPRRPDGSTGDEALESVDDEDLHEQMRKLDEDFQKNLQRTKKVFDNRMDSLQRSQYEKEAQHLRTLERHEKEKAEFEKRLAQQEEQKNKRIEELQREWEDRRRETLAQRQRGLTNGHVLGPDVQCDTSPQQFAEHPPPSSTTSSVKSVSPISTEHKVPLAGSATAQVER